MKINTQISILANYDDKVNITVYDKDAHIGFLTVTLSHSQFVNAALNRLGNCEVEDAEVRGIDHIGKIQEYKPLDFPIGEGPYCEARQRAEARVDQFVPAGWVADKGFNSQNSFFTKDGEEWARTTIRRWVPREGGDEE